MACLPRILRFNQLKKSVTLFRNLTSNTSQNAFRPQILTSRPVLTHNPWIWQKNDKIDSPLISKIQIDFPNGLKYVPPIEDPSDSRECELPTTPNGGLSKEAARLIVIRRNKMKRHKLKKLRKRMKFEWAKRRQKRELAKEKAFQAILIKQCKEGEEFMAEKYVEERIAKFNEIKTQESKSKKKGLVDSQM